MKPRAAHIAPGLALLALSSPSYAGGEFPSCHAPFQALLDQAFAAYPAAGAKRAIMPAAPVVAKGQAHLFRTVIREEARAGPNFAGHYTIIRIGCGAGTTYLAIADALTGRVYFPKEVTSASDLMVETGGEDTERLNYRRDSAALIVIGTVNERLNGFGMYHYVWRAGRLHLVRFVPAATLCGLSASTRF
jgi:hypothetical protein